MAGMIVAFPWHGRLAHVLCRTIPHRRDAHATFSERHSLIHPVVALQHLLAVEAGQMFGAGLGEFDDAARADAAPAFAG